MSACTPRQPADEPVLSVEHLSVRYRLKRGDVLEAVSDVSFTIARGETLGLVGESGCGKSSLSRAILQLPPPSAGRVVLGGSDLTAARREALRELRPRLQVIFQDPISSLNPRRRVFDIVAEPLRVWGDATNVAARVAESLERVGLSAEQVGRRHAHELSGGQCQRVAIARSLMLGPDLLICDEAVSSLDVSIQAQILNLLHDLKAERRLAMLFISHDLAAVKNVSDRVAVMYLGRICEISPAASLGGPTSHPYTRMLQAAVPSPEPFDVERRAHAVADRDAPISPSEPTGCVFQARCPLASPICREQEPEFRNIDGDRFVACHNI